MANLIFDIVEASPEWFSEGVSEYELIRRLQHPPHTVFDKDALRDPLQLFQTHFIVFNALYRLQSKWLADGTGYLVIHSTYIVLTQTGVGENTPDTADPLRDYYLAWHNYNTTDAQAVEGLLDSFWQRYVSNNTHQYASEKDIEEARQTLELGTQVTISVSDVKRQYRRLQHVHHPDKGGDPEKSKQILHAYVVLSNVLKHQAL